MKNFYYAKKGKYKNGISRIVIVNPNRPLKTKAIPKPEKLWKILDSLKNEKNSS